MGNFSIITNQKNWMESTAIEQVRHISEYKGVVSAVGLPDLHAGRSPVGIAVKTEGFIYPYLIGGDIGCGMGLFNTGVALRKYKSEKWTARLNYIRELGDIPADNTYAEDCPIPDLGTIGGGNHFAEFQKIETVYDAAASANINSDDVMLLIHSGSRSYGQRLMNQFLNEDGYEADSADAAEYLKYHDHAVLWARRNRLVVANKLINWLGFGGEAESVIDCAHNYIEKTGSRYIHRKGAASALNGLIVIPGSRGTLTYIVKPAADCEKSLCSLSHGAGRKWARSLCKSRIKNKYDRDTIRRTDLKSSVVCHDTDLLYQEAPEAYKNIEDIINALREHELIEIVAALRPLITYKG